MENSINLNNLKTIKINIYVKNNFMKQQLINNKMEKMFNKIREDKIFK
jgi:hypothetical protein